MTDNLAACMSRRKLSFSKNLYAVFKVLSPSAFGSYCSLASEADGSSFFPVGKGELASNFATISATGKNKLYKVRRAASRNFREIFKISLPEQALVCGDPASKRGGWLRQ